MTQHSASRTRKPTETLNRAVRMAAAGALAMVMGLPIVFGANSAYAQAGAAATWERCYGIAKAGENDGMAQGEFEEVPGTSEVDYDGLAWVLVETGTCTEIETPAGKGSLEPVTSRAAAR